MDIKRETRAKDEQITLVRNRLERLKLEEQKVSDAVPRCLHSSALLYYSRISVLFQFYSR
jgi:hypothetical protein